MDLLFESGQYLHIVTVFDKTCVGFSENFVNRVVVEVFFILWMLFHFGYNFKDTNHLFCILLQYMSGETINYLNNGSLFNILI